MKNNLLESAHDCVDCVDCALQMSYRAIVKQKRKKKEKELDESYGANFRSKNGIIHDTASHSRDISSHCLPGNTWRRPSQCRKGRCYLLPTKTVYQ